MSWFRPYFNGECQPVPVPSVAYIRVQATKEPRANGSITVFLANGTALNVRKNDLLRFDPGSEMRTPIESTSGLGEERCDA